MIWDASVKFASQVITWADEEPTARKERSGKIIVTLEEELAL